MLPAVQGWLSDQYPNHGLVIRGHIEDFPINDNACRALLSNFELHLSYTWVP